MAKINLKLPPSFYEEEEKSLRVDSQTKHLWAVELDLLAELKRVCCKHNIKFFAISGTLIGAARHHGFIPWDDDIDVVMMRSEYEKLEKIAKKEFNYPYFFQTNITDLGSARGHAQLRNSSTTAIMRREMIRDVPLFHFNQGVFLDIFPLDKIPDDSKELHSFMEHLKWLKSKFLKYRNRECFFRNRTLYPKSIEWYKTVLAYKLQHFYEKFFHEKLMLKWYLRFENYAQQYNAANTKRCSPICYSQSLRKHEVFNISDFEESIELDFEMMQIPCPKNYDNILQQAFGDWHKHVIGTSSHGSIKIDLDRPYTYYLHF